MNFAVSDEALGELGEAVMAAAGPLASGFAVAHGELNVDRAGRHHRRTPGQAAR